jgi:hypothetical protein
VIRARIELGMAAVFAVLTAVTLVWPTWIESLIGLAPDRGSGEAEWWVVVAFGLATIGLGLLGGRDYVRVTRATARPDGNRP